MRIEWTAEAAAELEQMLAFIASRSPEGAALVAERMLKMETSILQFPRAGKFDVETNTFDRYIPKTLIVLTYTIRSELVWIVTIWHTSRDPEAKTTSTS